MRDPLRARSRGWLKPLGSVLLFAISFLFFDRLIFMGLRGAAANHYGNQVAGQNKLRIALQKKKVHGLIFGTSRARKGISQKILAQILKRRIHKEALAGKYPAYNQLFFRRLRPCLGNVRFVVYAVDYFIFRYRSAIKEMANLRIISKEDVLNPQGNDHHSPFSFARFSLLYRLKPEIDEFFADWLGWDTNNRDEATDEAPRGREKEKWAEGEGKLVLQPPPRWRRKAYGRFPGAEGQNFLELIRELSSRRIATFLVILPDYVGTNETNYEQEAFKKELRSLAARFPLTFVLDFNTPARFHLDDPSLFSNGGWGRSNSHLSDRGRLIVSRKIALAIKSRLRIR
jgi:hypothetical protein